MSRIFFTLYDRHVHHVRKVIAKERKDHEVDNIKNNKNIYIHLVNLKQNDDEMNGKREIGWGLFVNDVKAFEKKVFINNAKD